jgi:transcriptional regulator PpsR
LRYSFHSIGPDGAILMMGRDLKPVAQMQQQLVDAQIALERDYEKQRDIATRLRVMMETAHDAILFVSAVSGRIVDVNGRAARLVRAAPDDLRGTLMSRWFTLNEDDLDIATLCDAAQDEEAAPLTLTVPGRRSPLTLRPTMFRAAGERLLLCRVDRISGPDGEEEGHSRMRRLFEQALDGLVFVDRQGTILAANEAFLALVELGDVSAIRGGLLSEYLARGAVDARVILDNSVKHGQMRDYGTRLLSRFGSEVPVDLSAVYLEDPSHGCIALTIRDTRRSDSAASGPGGGTLRPTRDLVGSATLKEIVSDTTEVIEKICIETAIELTGNNRVAAAEMLGLSRQSLYVKLRKYGLLNKNDRNASH